MSTSVNLGKIQISYKGEYSPTETYSMLDRVSLNGTWFECKTDGTINIEPIIGSDNVNWLQLNNIEPGKDGFSPTAVVSKVDNLATITLIDKNGSTTATISDGRKGDTGEAPTIEPEIDVVTLEPGSNGSGTIQKVSTNENRYKLYLNIPRGDVGPEPIIPKATSSEYGIIKAGNHINIDDGVISVSESTVHQFGVVKLNNTYISESVTEAATANMLKFVYDKTVAASIAAQNAQTTADNASTVASNKWTAVDASTTTKGIVKIGNNISVSGGVISVQTATTNILGLVKIGTGLNIDGTGEISISNASSTKYGLVKIGSNINVSDGTISIPVATTSVFGVTKLSNESNSTDTTVAATPKAVKTVNDAAVHITGDQSISGVKTFSDFTYTKTPATNDNSTKVATTAFVKNCFVAAGTRMLFQQSAAPSGWTKETNNAYNNIALRLTTGNIANKTNGRTFTACMATGRASANNTQGGTISNATQGGTISNTTAGGTVGNKALSVAMLAAHTHTVPGTGTAYGSGTQTLDCGTNNPTRRITSSSTGSGSSHNHGFTGNSHGHTFTGKAHGHTFTGQAHNHTIDFDINYIDCIVAVKA